MTSEGGVFVSSEQIFNKVDGVEKGLGRVEALLTQHIALEEQRSAGTEVRLENHGTRIGDIEGRITQAESDIRALRDADESREKRDVRKATWPQIVGVVAGIIAATGGLVGLLITLSNITQALTHLP